MSSAPAKTHSETLGVLSVRANLPDSIVVKGQSYAFVGDQPLGDGLNSVVWKAEGPNKRARAIKLCPITAYKSSTLLSQEIDRASQLEGCDAFATFVDAEQIRLTLSNGESHELVAIVEHFVDGITLFSYLKNSPSSVTPSFMRAYIRGVCIGLQALKVLNLSHNDLHLNNVMIAEPSLGDLDGERRIKIVDMGSIRSSGSSTGDDHLSFVDHLVHIWNTMRRSKNVVIRERRFLKSAKQLIERMLEEDGAVALRDPTQIVEQFESAYERSLRPPREDARDLKSPFEFISADHIADDRLLVEIFARSCPWLDKVSGPDPCLVTGPRGCGKSTIFRWLSLKAHLHKSAEDIERDLRITGFYVSCSADLQNRLSWIRTDADVARFRHLIVHYFNLLVAREVIKTLVLISTHPDRDSYWGLGVQTERQLYDFISATIGASDAPRLRGVSRYEQALEIVEAELFGVQMDFQTNTTTREGTAPSFIGDLTQLLSSVPHFLTHKIVILLDDFSTHRITEPVQTLLNQIIWERRPSHVFKLSSEKHGAVLNDELLASSELTRERIEIDCGQEYLALNDTKQEEKTLQFAIDLLNNRLTTAKYTGNALALLGKSQWPAGTLAKSLAIKGSNPQPSDYHGLDCIANLCSGDVASLLLVYSTIFAAGNVTQASTSLVSKHVQDKAIVDVSRKMREVIKSYYPYGREMYTLVNAFGNFVRSVLQEGALQSDGDPTQIPRIEIDQPSGDVATVLPEEEQKLAWELVRRAIFIEMEPGLSRHKNWSTLRWNLRRIYLPAFRAALTKNDAVKRGPAWFTHFLRSPETECVRLWRDWPKRSNGDASQKKDEHPLFRDAKEG